VNPAPEQLKAALRRQLRQRLAQLTPAAREAAAHRVCARLRAERSWQAARHILFYAALPDELDLQSLLAEALVEGKTTALPRFDPSAGSYQACRITDPRRDLRPGRYGILEPPPEAERLSLNRLDFVLVPGVGFTLDGCRLGRGKGYYDRLLRQVGGAKCGVAYDEQIVAALPLEPQDVVMDWILTPTRWCRAGQARF
jgi:5-formyltetrahydrofolate cyclo-ligase